MPPIPFKIDGQTGWAHDEGLTYGFFHTFDALDVSSRFAPRKVHVLLPWDYASTSMRYGVVYLHDGDTAFWRGGEANKTWDVAGVLGRISHRVNPVIAVAIHPVERAEEYTHDDWHHGQRPFGRLAEHADYLADEIKTFIDRNYRTLTQPSANAIVGSSHGGLAAFWTAHARPDAFGLAGALSPSFWVGLDSLIHEVEVGDLATSRLLEVAGPTLADPGLRPRLWLDWGRRRDNGFHNEVIEAKAERWTREMITLLRERYGYDLQDLQPGETPRKDAMGWVYEDQLGGHDEDAWSYRFGLLMQAFFPR